MTNPPRMALVPIEPDAAVSPAGGKVSRAQVDTAARAIFDAMAELGIGGKEG